MQEIHKKTIAGLVATIVIVLGLFMAGRFFMSGNAENDPGTRENIVIADGRQIIEVEAGASYSPSHTLAQADILTTLRMKTAGTISCSSSLVIPAIKYQGTLPISGQTDIDIPPQKAGSVLRGICSSGMTNFAITFN